MRTVRSVSLRTVVTMALTVGLGAFGFVAVSAPSAQAATPACQRTFSSGTIDYAIPDNNIYGTQSYIPMQNNALVVSDVNVTVNIHHTRDEDLSIGVNSYTVEGDYRTQTRLFTESGREGDNLLGTTFDDQATVPVGWGAAPFTGTFKPQERLAAFNGGAGGFYVLYVVDGASGNTGILNNWSITITYRACDFDVDGVEDHRDGCRGIAASTPSGCPATTRKLTATYSSGAFRGRMSSPVAACKAARSVTIWKSISGPDRLIGRATTRSDGTYRLAKAKKAGRYYAKSAAVVIPNTAACPAVTSPSFRVG